MRRAPDVRVAVGEHESRGRRRERTDPIAGYHVHLADDPDGGRILDAGDRMVFLPAQAGAIAARGTEAVQHGQEHGPFDIELEAAAGQQLGQHVAAAGVAPEAFQDQGRPQAADPAGQFDA